MKKILVITLMLLMCVMVGCGSKNNKSEKQESLEETIIGMWITSAGTADSTARIYKFYESGIMDSYIGNTKDEPLTGSYELDGNTLYMNFFDRTNPKKIIKILLQLYHMTRMKLWLLLKERLLRGKDMNKGDIIQGIEREYDTHFQTCNMKV